MSVVNNPFLIYAYAGHKYFCNRIEETEHLISALRNGRNVTLMSPRRMGKTGLIQNVFHQIRRDYPEAACFYMEMFSTTCLDDFIIQCGQTVIGKLDNLSQKTLAAISGFFKCCRLVFSPDVLTGVPQATLDFQPSQAQATLKEIFDYLEHSGKECYIAIDEFQQITSYPEEGTEALLRSYIQFIPNVSFLFAGSSQNLMQEMFVYSKRPFYQSTQLMVLREIDEESYYWFARNFFELRGQELDKSVFHWIYTRFEGHTWYMQAMLNRLYERNESVVDITQAEQVLMGLLEENTPVYQNLIIMLTDNQLALMKAIAHEGKVTAPNSGDFILGHGLKTPSSVNAALKSLVEKELVYKSTGGYMVYDRFMGIWLLRN